MLAWQALPDRSRHILLRRLAGDTLREIAGSMSPPLTRERVRQLEKMANAQLCFDQAREAPELAPGLEHEAATNLVVSTTRAQTMIGTGLDDACRALLAALGYEPATELGPVAADYWSSPPQPRQEHPQDRLKERLRRLTDLVPLTYSDAHEAARDIGLPSDLSWASHLDQIDGRLIRHELGWIRRSRSTRDIAYLWLKGEGEPREAAEMAGVVGCSDHTVREAMRRDPDFAQVRPEGTWALSDWRTPGADQRYASAVDVVVEVLRELGPLAIDQLRVETRGRYPVTDWRIHQCLSSNMIGRLPDGKYDLAERGATPIEDDEPRQPDNMRDVGDVVGVTLPVTRDILRGSGIPVSRWLTWRLGLRTAPATRHLELPGGLGTVRVTRGTSTSQISSLRLIGQHLGVREGCTLTLLVNTARDTADVRHSCVPGACDVPG